MKMIFEGVYIMSAQLRMKVTVPTSCAIEVVRFAMGLGLTIEKAKIRKRRAASYIVVLFPAGDPTEIRRIYEKWTGYICPIALR